MFGNIRGKRVAVYTLGCKVNQYESDSMMDMLAEAGCRIVPFEEKADIYIINTCSVTNMAERKSRQIIHRAKKKNPDAVIVAAGCYVQAARGYLEQGGFVDLVVGNNRKKDMPRLLDMFFARHEVTDNYTDIAAVTEYESMSLVKPREHCRAFVKVQDGCNNFCSYCIIPYTRGRIRSRELEESVTEVRRLASEGIREVVLTGINLSSYCDNAGNHLSDLIREVSKVDGILRVRLGSLEPRVITEDFLAEICNNKKVCPHFHLSLQSACNDTLKRMNRHYTIEEYKEKCALLRRYYDRPAITTDVIVGFPQETDEEFDITCRNLEALKLYEMHVFKYSPRAGTAAASMPGQVEDAVKEKRSNVLLDMTARHKMEYEASFSGETVSVLVEEYGEREDGCYIKGHTDRYIMIERQIGDKNCTLHANDLIFLNI